MAQSFEVLRIKSMPNSPKVIRFPDPVSRNGCTHGAKDARNSAAHSASALGRDRAPVPRGTQSSHTDADAQQPTLTEDEARKKARTSWRAMKDRCRKDGSLYTYDPAWEKFEPFLSDVGLPKFADHTLDRLDNSIKEYGPGNVRWADKRQQSNNRRNSIRLTSLDGTSRPLTEWAEKTGQKADTMRRHRLRGWSHQEIIDGKRKDQTKAQAVKKQNAKHPWQEFPWGNFPTKADHYRRKFLASSDSDPWGWIIWYLNGLHRDCIEQLSKHLADGPDHPDYYCPPITDAERAELRKWNARLDWVDTQLERAQTVVRLRQEHEWMKRRLRDARISMDAR